jgi:hypothetical protein
MATVAEIENAIIRADAAGDGDTVRRLAPQLEAARLEERRAAFYVPRDTGFFEDVGSGFGAGVVDVGEMAALGAATLLEEEDELAARKRIQDVAKYLRPRGGDPESTTYKLASGVGSIFGAVAPAVGAAFLPVSAPVATGLGALTAGAIGVGAGAGEASERARAAGTPEDVRSEAALKGAIVGATNIIPLGRILRVPGVSQALDSLASKIGAETVEGGIRRVRSAAATGAVEGVQEGAEGILQNLIEQGYNPERALIDAGVLEEASIGAGAGALVQAVADLFIRGRTRRGRETGPAQGELFPEADLGTAPPPPAARQGELFPTEDLGRAPEEGTQLDLFGPRASQAAALRQRIRDLELERQRTIRSPMAPFEEAGDPFLERTKAEIDQARAQLAELEGRVEPQQRELPFENVPGAAAEQVAQAAARERAGLAAAERGDEAAFEQPDLFALQQEQEARRLGTPRSPVDQFMDVQEEAEVTPPPIMSDARQLDIEDAIRTRQLEDAEIAEIEAEIAADEELRALSRLETADARRDTLQQQETIRRRGAVLSSVLENLDTTSRVNVERRFSKALEDEGISDVTPTDAERNTIRRATDAVAAGRPVEPEVIEPRLEYQIREDEEGVRRRVYQTEVPFVPERRGPQTATVEEAVDATTTEPEPTADRDGISDIAPVLDVAEPALTEGAGAPGVAAPTPSGLGVAGERPRGFARRAAPEQLALDLSPQQISLLDTPLEERLAAEADMGAAIEAELGIAEPEVEEAPKPTRRRRIRALEPPVTPTRRAKRPSPLPEGEIGRAKVWTDEEIQVKKEELAKRNMTLPPKVEERLRTGNYTPDETTITESVLTGADTTAIDTLVSDGTTTRDADGAAVIAYMRPKEGTKTYLDGLSDAVYDLVFSQPQYRTPPNLRGADLEQAKLYLGTGGKAAARAVAWAEANLSDSAKRWLANKRVDLENQLFKESLRNGSVIDDINTLNKKLEKLTRVETVAEGLSLDEQVREYLRTSKLFNLSSDAVLASALPLPPKVVRALESGNLNLALGLLGSDAPNNSVKNAANKLANAVGDTKVEVVENLKDEAGMSVAGLFDPKSNTIKLAATEGMNAHVLLHEMVHAAASATLANKNHPMTRQLTKLFDDVKPMLDSAYGATNVDEFVSEAMSNPQFQQKLAGMNPGGTEITAWQRFTNSVGNFVRKLLGMQPKAISNVLSQADLFIDAILTPAPAFRDAADLPMNSSRSGVKRVAEEVGRTAKQFRQNTPDMREKFSDSAAQFLNKGVGDTLKNWYLRTLGSQPLGDVAKKLGFGDLGYMFDRLANEQRGAMATSDEFVRGRVLEANNWHNSAGAEKVRAFKNLIYSRDYGATVYQVDPTLTETEAKNRYDDEKFAVWKKQRSDWNEIGKDGQRIYNLMRDTYRVQYDKLKKIITGRINAFDMPKDAKERLTKNVYDRLFSKQTLDVYFPLIREGQYKVSYAIKPEAVTPGQDSYVVERFENYKERDRAADALRQDPNIIKDSVKTEDGDLTTKSFDKAPPMSFVSQTLQTLEAANVPSETREQIINLFLNAVPENSFARSLQGRGGPDGRGVAGHLDDPFLALQTKGYDIGRQTVRLEFGAKLDALEKDIVERAQAIEERGAPAPRTAAGKAVGAVPTKLMLDELTARIQFTRSGAKNKQMEKYVRNANQLAFVYTIGFNAASSLVNLSQVPLFVLPMLGGKYGERTAAKELARAARLVTGARIGSKSDSKLGKVIDKASIAYGIDAYYDVTADGDFIVRKDLKLDKARVAELERLAPLVRLASNRGQLNRSYLLDALGLEEGGRARGGNVFSRNMDRITSISAMMFNQAERFNRQTTMVAAYNLALNKMTGGKPDTATVAQRQAAAEEALYDTQATNGGSVLETAPRLSQEGIGRVAMMYKTYGLQMYYTMMKTAKEMVEAHIEGDKATRDRAFKQLLGIHGSAVFFAGIYGVPLYGAVQLMADMLFLDDDEDDFNTLVRKELGEGWFKGPLQAALGINVADRMRLSGLLIQENRYNPNASVEEDIMYYLGGPALSIGKRFIRGVGDLREGNMERGVESLLPPAVANAYKTTFGRYQQDGGIYTRRNDPIYADMNTWEMMAQGVGFMPAEYAFRQEQNQRDKRVERSVVTKRTNLMRRYYVAQRTGDLAELVEVMSEMADFGIRHPDAAISSSDLDKSIKRHEKTSSEMYNGVTINPLVRRAIELSRMEYSQ